MDYKGPIEAVLSTDLRGEPYNFSLWDLYTGTQLVVFKGNKNNPVANCLQLIDNNYFITAHDNVLHVWSIYNRKCQSHPLFLPKRPSTLCISPCANYLIAGISETIYVWQLHSGNLLAKIQRHYQTVSVLKMNRDGTFLFSAGEDGCTLVWPFADLISCTEHSDKSRLNNKSNEPKFSWQHHRGPISGVHVSAGRLCLTCSVDKSLNIYNYHSGTRLYNIELPTPIWSVVMNKNETTIFLGGQDGNIYQVLISSISVTQINSEDESDLREPIFSGHKGKVVDLIISTDGTRLVSASVDSTCKVWNIQQRKMLQDIKHQAPLANLKSLLVPESLALTSMTQSNTEPALALKPLKRDLYKVADSGTVKDDELFDELYTQIVNVKNPVDRWTLSDSNSVSHNKSESFLNPAIKLKQSAASKNSSSPTKTTNEQSSSALKKKMRELYQFSAEKIFQDSAKECLAQFKPVD